MRFQAEQVMISCELLMVAQLALMILMEVMAMTTSEEVGEMTIYLAALEMITSMVDGETTKSTEELVTTKSGAEISKVMELK